MGIDGRQFGFHHLADEVLKEPCGFHPSSALILAGDPTSRPDRPVVRKPDYVFTYFSGDKLITAKAASTKSRTE